MKEDKIRLSHILESVDKILSWISGVKKEEFMAADQLQDAVIRRFEVIGEATKSISNTTREKYPDIPWKEMAGMRDMLIHEYFDVDLEEVWDTCVNDLPDLKRKILNITGT